MSTMIRSAVLTSGLLAVIGVAQAVPIVVNGDFETGDPDSWVIDDGGVGSVADYSSETALAPAPAGPNSLKFTGDKGSGTYNNRVNVTTTVQILPNTDYTVSFWKYGKSTDAYFRIDEFPGAQSQIGGTVELANSQTTGWIQLSATVTAADIASWPATNQTRWFNDPWPAGTRYDATGKYFGLAIYGDAGTYIDGISITAIPEPATGMLLIGSMGLLGLRRKSRQD